MRFADKTTLITGGDSGIGLATARLSLTGEPVKAEPKVIGKMRTRWHVPQILHFVTGDASLTCLLLLALAVCFVSIPARAQGGIWQVDAEHSIARLSLGSGSQSTEVGVAHVSGNLVFDSSDPADPVVDLNIKPDTRVGPDHSEISFKSKRSAITIDGKLAVVGDLSVTRVERGATLDPNEAYRGAEYSDPAIHIDTQEVTLVFPGASLPAAQKGAIQLSALTNIGREGFPQLLAALAPGNWPSMVVEDENCTMPSTAGEDYSGAICTGTPVPIATNSLVPATNGGSEDYRGFEAAVAPNGNQATIALNLILTQVAPTLPAASSEAKSAGK